MWSTVQVGTASKERTGTTCQAPSSRSKHAMCVTQNDMIYLLGGRSANLPLKDLWRFDPAQNQWEEPRCRGNRPPCLQEHTMVAWKNMLYVFGGEIGFASTGETPLWILDTGTSTWRKHHVRGLSAQQPTGRRGHTAVVYNGGMHVYGGYQDLRGSSSELWSFDFATERWHMTLVPSQGEQPPPRHNHSCVVHDGSMWVYGGLTDLQARGDFWKWDFVSRQWSRLKCQRGPGELHGHSAVKAMSYMYLFGGERAGVVLNELWRYHFATESWERIQAEGVLPSPRCRHVAIANPALQNWENSKLSSWGVSDHQHQLLSGRCHERSTNPPKSISMCFGQPTEPENGRKHFKFKVHPVSRLCSKATSSDDEDEDEEYTVSYNHNAAQVNVTKSLREKISSSRLVRSISSGSYSILHNQGADVHHDELERLVEETTPQQQRSRPAIQKSQSSDAVLESDSESATPQHKARPRSEILPATTTPSGPPPQWDGTAASVSRSSSKDRVAATNGEVGACCCCHGNNTSFTRGGGPFHAPCDNCRHSNPSRTVRLLGYEGPLTTVRDVEDEDNSDQGIGEMMDDDDAGGRRRRKTSGILIELDGTSGLERTRSGRFTSSATLSDLASQTCTPSIESRGLPHSVSHSSGYHSFTDDEGADGHREFAGCLNPGAVRKASLRSRELELKTFTPTHQGRGPPQSTETETIDPNLPASGKERSRSWDRASQRRHGRSYPMIAAPSGEEEGKHKSWCVTAEELSATCGGVSPSRRWSRSPAKSRLEQHHWQLCLYVFGGREQGAPGVYRQPISVWQLYV